MTGGGCDDLLQHAFSSHSDIQGEVPRLREHARQFSKLKEMPWKTIAQSIADGVNRQDTCLESADDMMSIEHLREQVQEWRKECPTVDKLIAWSLFPRCRAAKILADFSRPGAYEQPFLP